MDVALTGTSLPLPRWSRRQVVGGVIAAGMLPSAGSATAAIQSLSGSLATALVALRGTPVPHEVAERTAWTLLDVMGTVVYGASLAGTRNFLNSVRARSGQPATMVFGAGRAAPIELAAAANAFLIHAAEIDDSDLRAQLRASAVIMPTALALAEARDIDGAAFIRAAAMGYTLQGRLAAPLGPIQRFGWMASGVWGPPAAAAMAADMMELSTPQMASAIGLAGSASGGSFQYFFDQTEEKRLIVARAARTAVESAMLASAGEPGPSFVFEGQAGLYRLFGDRVLKAPDAATLVANLGSLEGPLFIHPKFYAASHSIIPTLDGIDADIPRTIDIGAIDRVIVRGDAGWAAVLADKINQFTPPATLIGAMINYSFVISLFLARRTLMPDDITESVIRDPAMLALARKARFETVPGPADLSVELVMADGVGHLAHARTPAADKPAPFQRTERLAKFEGLTARMLSADRRSKLQALCLGVGTASSMRRWAREVQRVVSG
jgi:2-methylcitrate dehydratase PrpD